MAFCWKDHNNIWKGEGVYFLTYVVVGRRPLLGTLMPISASRWYMRNVQRSSYINGKTTATDTTLTGTPTGTPPTAGTVPTQGTATPTGTPPTAGTVPAQGSPTTTGTQPTAGTVPAQGSPTTTGTPPTAGTPTQGTATPEPPTSRSYIGSVARSPSSAAQPPTSRSYIGSVARSPISARSPINTTTLALCELTPFGMAVSRQVQALPSRVAGLKVCAKQIMPDHIHLVVWLAGEAGSTIRQIGNGLRVGIKRAAIELGIWQEADGHILDTPYIRTLAHKGQLRSMIDYVHANPDHAWLRHLNPDLYTIQRDIELADLCFDGMGKDRLLAYPDRQVIALSRSLTPEQIEQEVTRALRHAERGTVTYTAAINDGERAVAKAVREAGFPLVVLLLEGFPPEGSEAARHYRPDGVYRRTCGEGRLMLLAPKPDNYQSPTLIALTDQELERKAHAKGLHYTPLPHDTQRWRMIAGNVMLGMVAFPVG